MPVNITGKDRIDVHCHVVLDQYLEGLKVAGGDPSGSSLSLHVCTLAETSALGWVAPPWSPELAISAMDQVGVKKQVLSITSPGPSIVGANEAGRKLTRGCNDETAAIVEANPDRFAFFASTPSWIDVEGAIAEIEHSMKTLKAQGMVVMTSYGDKYACSPSHN